MLYTRTQAGDHGHPRAFARVGLPVLPIVENIQKSLFKRGHTIGHCEGFTWVSKPNWRQVYPNQYRMLYARTQAGDHGHPRASARVGLSVLSQVENTHTRTSVNLENKSATAKGSF